MSYITEKIQFKVFNKQGQDITDEQEWLISTEGTLYFKASGSDELLHKADDCYYTLTNCKRELKWN